MELKTKVLQLKSTHSSKFPEVQELTSKVMCHRLLNKLSFSVSDRFSKKRLIVDIPGAVRQKRLAN